LAVEGEGEAAVGDLKLRNAEGFGSAGRGDRFIGGINAVGKGKEVVTQIEGRAGEAEEFQAVMGEAVPGEGDVDAVEREDGGQRIVGGVGDEILGGGRLEFRGGFSGGAGAEADLGEKEGGGVAEAEGGDGEAGAEVVDEEGGFGNEELLDGEPSYAKATEGSGASRGCQATQPAPGLVKANLGDLAEEHSWGEAQSEGLDAEGVAVADVADLQQGKVEPAGGGDRGGATGEKEEGANGEGRREDAGEEGQSGSNEDETETTHEIKIKMKMKIREISKVCV
jgi:hypothetical protein